MKGNKAELQERFIELRAEGRSYADIAADLDVSKPTLIAWAKDLADDISNAKTIRLDALFERYRVGKAKRIEAFGKRLDAILTELDTRDLAEVKTDALLALALKYGDAMKAEAEPLELRGRGTIFPETWTP